MPWTVKNPPSVAKNWSASEKEKCVKAANAALKAGKSDKDAVLACIHAAGKSKGDKKSGESDYEYKATPSWFEPVEGEAGKGVVKHLISLFGVVDSKGDIAHKGMFTKTIAERKADIAVVDYHRRDSVLAVVGFPLTLEDVGVEGLPGEVKARWPEATGGLMATTQFLLDTPEGLGVYNRIKAGAVSKFSYAFKPLDFDHEFKGMRRIRNLRTVKLLEYGPCLSPVNEGAMVLDVKAQSLSSWVSEVKETFYNLQEPYQEVARVSVIDVIEVFEGYLIVRGTDEGNEVYYQVSYRIEDEKYVFDEMNQSKWVTGKYEFVPNAEVEDDTKAEDTSPYDESLLQLELELLETELKGIEARSLEAPTLR